MRKLDRDASTPRFVPDYMATSVLGVDFALLSRLGIRYVAFDADSTLVPFRGKVIDVELQSYLAANRKLFTGWCIASNRLTNDLEQLAKSMDATVIRAKGIARKPSRKFYDRVIKHFDSSPEQIVMIGDKLLADIYGAKRAGMTTVWVEQLGADNPIDRLTHIRHFEKRFLKNYLHE